jgi:glucose-6-phosphate 1-epimerase
VNPEPTVIAFRDGSASLPPGVRLTAGRSGLPRVEVTTSLASAEVYLQGAHVAAYAPGGGAPVLFLSEASRFAPGLPIRGGIPLAFPWFARKAADPAAPLHGLARLVPWTLEAATQDAAGVVGLTFALAGVSDPAWPEGCALRYRVEIGGRLRLVLEVDNHGPGPVVFENVLHTYLAVDDVGQVSVTGLEGAPFVDEADGSARRREGSAPLRVRGETVRIYDHRDAPCVVEDPGRRRRLEVTKTGSASTVVWNPGAERARALPDLGDDEWPGFVCVESGNVGSGGAVHLASGAGHRLDVSVRALPWGGV